MPRVPAVQQRGSIVTTQVDTLDVDRMIERVMLSLSGPNLERFLFDQGHEHFERRIVNRFAVEGDSASGWWPELSDATMEIKEALGAEPYSNVRTSDMFHTVTEEADFWFADNYAEMILPGKAAHGLVAEKIRTAQEGKATNPISNFGPTPPRPILAVDEQDLAQVMTDLTTFIMTDVAAGL